MAEVRRLVPETIVLDRRTGNALSQWLSRAAKRSALGNALLRLSASASLPCSGPSKADLAGQAEQAKQIQFERSFRQ